MFNILSVIPYYQYSVLNWPDKKKKLLSEINSSLFYRNNSDEFYTDKGNSQYLQNFLNIFDSELQSLGHDLKANKLEILDVWCVKYKMYDFHVPHTHGNCDLSGILYFDFIEDLHSPTYYVIDSMHHLCKNTLINTTENVKEGDMLIFPSNLLHFTKPNFSTADRIIISFDIKVN